MEVIDVVAVGVEVIDVVAVGVAVIDVVEVGREVAVGEDVPVLSTTASVLRKVKMATPLTLSSARGA